jgi:hypothetical protein
VVAVIYRFTDVRLWSFFKLTWRRFAIG